jgi:hypothetical protein
MNQLSKSEFLTRLARTASSGWTVTAQGMLRDGRGRCPVVAVAEDIYLQQADGPTAYRRVADAIGLPAAIAEEIVFAADHEEPRLPVRDRLLDACRVLERNPAGLAGCSGWWWDQPTIGSGRWAFAEGVQDPLPFEPGSGGSPAVPLALAFEEQVAVL